MSPSETRQRLRTNTAPLSSSVLFRKVTYTEVQQRRRELPEFVLFTAWAFARLGEQSAPAGCGPFSVGRLAEDLDLPIEQTREVFTKVCTTCGWVYDPERRWLWVPEAFRASWDGGNENLLIKFRHWMDQQDPPPAMRALFDADVDVLRGEYAERRREFEARRAREGGDDDGGGSAPEAGAAGTTRARTTRAKRQALTPGRSTVARWFREVRSMYPAHRMTGDRRLAKAAFEQAFEYEVLHLHRPAREVWAEIRDCLLTNIVSDEWTREDGRWVPDLATYFAEGLWGQRHAAGPIDEQRLH